MWRTRCVRLLGGGSTGSKHATDVSRLHFDAIVVGAGTSGCLVAGRLGMENLKTLVIEEGIDIRRRSEWHWTLPCSMLEHRLARRGYESDDTDTVPQRTFSSFSSPPSSVAQDHSSSLHASSPLCDEKRNKQHEASHSQEPKQQNLHDAAAADDAEADAAHNASAHDSVTDTRHASSFSSSTLSPHPNSPRQVIRIPTPRVLGGHGVMGSRCWGYGDERDWEQTPWSFREELLPHLRLFENPEVFVPHRGRRGRFTLSHGATFSPYYKAFCESIARDVPLLSHLIRSDCRVSAGCGRTDLLVDPHSGKAHSTLRRYLLHAIQLQRPVRVECGSRVIGIAGEGCATPFKQADTSPSSSSSFMPMSKQEGTKSHACAPTVARGVSIRRADGSVVEVSASMVIVCAGTIGSARLLHASRRSLAHGTTGVTGLAIPDTVGRNFWDVPQLVLQYRCKRRDSYNCLSDPLVRTLLRSDLMMGAPRRCLLSSWDDLILYGDDDATRKEPDVEIIFQPFTLCSDGTQPIPGEHGCQFIVRPLRPRSRGVIAADGSIDPNYFEQSEDLQAVQRGVDYVKRIVRQRESLRRVVGELFAERLESAGLNGGSCSSVMEPSTFRLTGTSNVYVCGSSILPCPLSGPVIPYTMVMADRFVDSLLRKREVREKTHAASTGAAHIVF